MTRLMTSADLEGEIGALAGLQVTRVAGVDDSSHLQALLEL